VDQIHLWAATEFRTFILEHLRPWHTFCDENYLLDWDSVYDTSPHRKRKRTCSENGDLSLPSWISLLNEPARLKVQVRAKESLARAIKEHQLRKGKAKCSEDSDSYDCSWSCMMDNCRSIEPKFESTEAWLNHMRCVHGEPKWNLLATKRLIQEAEQEKRSNHLAAPFADDVPGPSQKRVRVR
jgi:hypothetical protein